VALAKVKTLEKMRTLILKSKRALKTKTTSTISLRKEKSVLSSFVLSLTNMRNTRTSRNLTLNSNRELSKTNSASATMKSSLTLNS